MTPVKIFTCTLPDTRTDGIALPPEQIAEVRFYVSSDAQEPRTWQQTGTSGLCTIAYTLSDVADGVYFYTADVVDTEGRESIKAPDILELEVKRQANPAPPSNLGWQ